MLASDTNELRSVLCQRCRTYRVPSSFFKNNREMKTCTVCREKEKLRRALPKNRSTQWVNSSKAHDLQKDRYDPENHVDRPFLEALITSSPTCYYNDCAVTLQYLEYQGDLGTLERINNNIGHTKDNCVICCLSCNFSRKSNSTTPGLKPPMDIYAIMASPDYIPPRQYTSPVVRTHAPAIPTHGSVPEEVNEPGDQAPPFENIDPSIKIQTVARKKQKNIRRGKKKHTRKEKRNLISVMNQKT